MTGPKPTDIQLHKKSGTLEIAFDSGERFVMPAEYLRVYSPSAEVRGHSPDEAVLQVGKEDVLIEKIELVGNYAIQIFFDDNHHTGIYSWETLYDLGKNQERHWQDYLKRLQEAGFERKVNRLDS